MTTRQARRPRAAVDLTFEELYRGHRDDVYRAALRELGNAHDAEDVTQAAFVDAYKAVLRGTQPQSPRAWLLAISENVRRRRFRTAQRRPREEALDDADFPLAADLSHEQAQALAQALQSLTPEQRRVFVLREIVGLSYDEIADEVDSTVASVQMLLFRARRSLRDELEPPTVAIQRAGGFLPPIPAWLAGLASRTEISALTPRAAGVLGAAALTVAGVSVAVPASQAEGRERPGVVAAKPHRTPTAKPVAVRPVAGTTAQPATTRAARSTRVSRSTSKPQPAPRSQPVATLPPTFVPDSASVAAAPAVAPAGGKLPAAPSPTLPSVPVASGSATIPVQLTPVQLTPVQLPAPPPVNLPLPVPIPAPLPVPPPVVVPPVVVPPIVPAPAEEATGSAGAAGAGAPPLPVPSLPLPRLPPTP